MKRMDGRNPVKYKQCIRVGDNVTDILRLPCVVGVRKCRDIPVHMIRPGVSVMEWLEYDLEDGDIVTVSDWLCLGADGHWTAMSKEDYDASQTKYREKVARMLKNRGKQVIWEKLQEISETSQEIVSNTIHNNTSSKESKPKKDFSLSLADRKEAYKEGMKEAFRMIEHEIDMCAIERYSFPILHVRDFIDKMLGRKEAK